jgi:hypothetical protein
MIRKAKSIGANGIILYPLVESGIDLQPFGQWKKSFYYKGSAISYE